jgi:hypothetical protein
MSIDFEKRALLYSNRDNLALIVINGDYTFLEKDYQDRIELGQMWLKGNIKFRDFRTPVQLSEGFAEKYGGKSFLGTNEGSPCCVSVFKGDLRPTIEIAFVHYFSNESNRRDESSGSE